MVILYLKNIKTKRLLKKFNTKYLSPFIVIKKISKLAYKLLLPYSIVKIYPIFYILLLED
jgi:hypothetical protein